MVGGRWQFDIWLRAGHFNMYAEPRIWNQDERQVIEMLCQRQQRG